VERPIRDVLGNQEAEGEVGRPAGLERRHDFDRNLILVVKSDLDLLARVLLESGYDFRNRFVFLEVGPLLPPHHEVGGLRAERRQNKRCGKKNGSTAHD
jgi:hypothetical protein